MSINVMVEYVAVLRSLLRLDLLDVTPCFFRLALKERVSSGEHTSENEGGGGCPDGSSRAGERHRD